MYIGASSGIHRQFLDEFCGPYIRRFILQAHMFIAGGSLVSLMDGQLPPRDIDIYVPSYEPEQFRGQLVAEAGAEYALLSRRDTVKYGGPDSHYLYLKYIHGRGRETGLHLIFWPLCDPMNIISRFDIEVCKIALVGNALVQGNRFQADHENRVINLGIVTYPNRTVERINRYRERGYRPSEATLSFMKATEKASGKAGKASEGGDTLVAPEGKHAFVEMIPLSSKDRPTLTATTTTSDKVARGWPHASE